jgi:predicted RNA-binding Zn-ribbon protein involved in translation (DUF1610 family)
MDGQVYRLVVAFHKANTNLMARTINAKAIIGLRGLDLDKASFQKVLDSIIPKDLADTLKFAGFDVTAARELDDLVKTVMEYRKIDEDLSLALYVAAADAEVMERLISVVNTAGLRDAWVFIQSLTEKELQEFCALYGPTANVGWAPRYAKLKELTPQVQAKFACPKCGGTNLVEDDHDANDQTVLKCASCGEIGGESHFLALTCN